MQFLSNVLTKVTQFSEFFYHLVHQARSEQKLRKNLKNKKFLRRDVTECFRRLEKIDKILSVLTVSGASLSLLFDFVLLASNFGLLAVTFATKSVLANLDRRSKAFSPVKGDRGREIFLLDFNVEVSTGMGSSRRLTGVKTVGDGGEIRPLSSTEVCEWPRGFCGMSLKIEVSEYERALMPIPGQGTDKRAGS